MTSKVPVQPRYLTLTELVFGYALFGGLGYLVGGWIGFGCGAGVVTGRYGYLIWRSAYAAETDGDADRSPEA